MSVLHIDVHIGPDHRAAALCADALLGLTRTPKELPPKWHYDERGSELVLPPGMADAHPADAVAFAQQARHLGPLADLHARGLRLAIDDFGTGYSSLSRLQHMPVDILKIDRSFVRDVDTDQSSGSMVSAIIALSRSLGLTPLAEGIETEEEWRFLVERGCPLGQGFLFSRPVPADEILARFRRSELRVAESA